MLWYTIPRKDGWLWEKYAIDFIFCLSEFGVYFFFVSSIGSTSTNYQSKRFLLAGFGLHEEELSPRTCNMMYKTYGLQQICSQRHPHPMLNQNANVFWATTRISKCGVPVCFFVKSRAAICKIKISVVNKDQLEIAMDWIVTPKITMLKLIWLYTEIGPSENN